MFCSGGDLRGFIGLAWSWWRECGSDPACPLKNDCGPHLSLSLYHDMSRYEYALTSLPNFTMANIAGPLYVLWIIFSAGYKRRAIKPDGSYGLTKYRNTRYSKFVVEQERNERQRLTA
jgi:hypothetical protein